MATTSDHLRVPWKLAWAVAGAATSVVVAAALAVAHLRWIAPTAGAATSLIVLAATVLVVGVAGVVVVAMARRVITRGRSRLLAAYAPGARVTVCRWVTAAVTGYGLWIILVAVKPTWWPGWLAALAVLTTIVVTVAAAQDYLLTQVDPPPPPPTRAELEAHRARTDDPYKRLMRAALRTINMGMVTVVDYQRLLDGDGTLYGIKYRARNPAAIMSTNGKARSGAISASSGEALAVALSELLHVPLESGWVEVMPERVAGTWAVTVTTTDMMARVYPYTDDPTPTSITLPAMIGHQLDGEHLTLLLGVHGQAVGMTASGKSTLIQVIIAYITRCTDAELWICGTEKLYDLVREWIEAYVGTDFPLPFKVRYGQKDTTDMLVAAMLLARWRQKQRVPDPNWKKVIVILDEASFALRAQIACSIYAGRPVTSAQAVAMIMQGAGSAGVFIILATQRSTQDHKGDQGGDTNANVGWSAAFATSEKDEIGRLTGNYQAPVPQHRGEFLMRALGTAGVPRAKVPYIQSAYKPRVHNGPTIGDVAWARRNIPHGLDDASVAPIADEYRKWHTHATPDLLEYLTDTPGDLGPAVTAGTAPQPLPAGSSEGDAYQTAMRDIDTIIANAQACASDAVPVQRRSRLDRIVDIVAAADGELSRADIITGLREQGDDVNDPQTVTNALTKLVGQERLVRGDEGYRTPTTVMVEA